ncbi:MAG: flagellar biosynthesis protein FlgL [Lachnospiraceae bacterium]|nr:flagellar biosynthesis protein FlgL [Lachnospiraceae bacterium]
MRINHNALAYTANSNLAAADDRLTAAVERLSSGYKINSSKDDTAGMAISQKMRAQIRGLNRAAQNADDGVSMIQTAEATLGELQSMLTRVEELATQAANSINDVEDCSSIQEEIDNILAEIDRITQDMDFNGRKLLNGDVCRRSYSSDNNLKLYDISSSVEAGEYGIEVTADAEKAVVSGGSLSADKVFTEQEAGTLVINGMEISVKAGDTMEDVYGKMVDLCDKVGVDVYMGDAAGDPVAFGTDGSSLVVQTQEYGSKQYIQIDCSNDQLSACFSFATLGEKVQGKDAEVAFGEDDDGKRIGFSNTATLSVDGNKISVKDQNSFEMHFKVTPEAVADSGDSVSAVVTVLDAGPINLQIGAFEGENLKVNIPKVSTETLGLENISIYTHPLASDAIERVQKASSKISGIRSYLGACQNRLDYTIANLDETSENMEKAISGIMDTDMAEEMTYYTQQNVLSQSATQMLAKANALPENLLQLIQTN